MKWRNCSVIVLTVTATLIAPHAHADSKDPTAAEALFLAGRDAIERGDVPTACAKFAESDRLDPAAGTAANLADCEERIGKVGAAWAHWNEAVELLPTGDSRLGPMRARAAALEKRVPRLTVRAAPTLPSDAKIRRDGVEMTRASLDTAIPDDPGDHEIVVVSSKHLDRSYKITLHEAESRELIVDAGDLAPIAPEGPRQAALPPAPPQNPPTDHDEHPGRTTRLIGFSLLGLGVVGAGVGTITGFIAIGKKNDLASNCFPANVCNAAGASDASSGRTFATVSTVSFIVAGAALAGGAVLVFTAPKSKSKAGYASPTTIAPLLGPGVAGIFAEKSF